MTSPRLASSAAIDPGLRYVREPQGCYHRIREMHEPTGVNDTVASEERAVLARAFHRLSRVVAEDQQLLTLPASTQVAAALELMRRRDFSQVPVVVGSEVIGLFSHRSLAEGLAAAACDAGVDVMRLPVEDFLDSKVAYADITDDVREIIGALALHDAILVGHKRHVTALVTRDDVVQYLHRISEPFMLIEEIERTTRLLMEEAVLPADVPALIRTRLQAEYDSRNSAVPTDLAALTLGELVQVLVDGRNWPRFEQSFGGNLSRARGRYDGIPQIRNDVFHFRGECSDEARQVLRTCRNWLLRRAQHAHKGSGGHV